MNGVSKANVLKFLKDYWYQTTVLVLIFYGLFLYPHDIKMGLVAKIVSA